MKVKYGAKDFVKINNIYNTRDMTVSKDVCTVDIKLTDAIKWLLGGHTA